MDIKKLQSIVINALEDVKAQEIRVFDTVHLTSLFDRIAIASGTSNRQTKALAASVRDKVKESGGNIVSIEGEDSGEWVLVDLGDMIVHIMQQPIRAYYRLEEIWGDKEIKLGDAKRAPKRLAASDDDAAPKAAKRVSRHLTAHQDADAGAAPKKTTARKTATKSAAGKTTAAEKASSKTVKVAAPKSTATKKTPAKSSAKTSAKSAVKAGTKRAATKRAPVKAKSA